MQLSFDPTTGLPEYRFDYTPSYLSFYVDGQFAKTWTGCLPQNSMKLYVNLWSPTWREGKRPQTEKFVPLDQTRDTGE